MNTAHEISYCVYDSECGEIRRKILAWIAARENEGWTVEMLIKSDDGRPAIMWQCISKPGYCGEFSPCIGMCGTEFHMN